jgi:putative transcriptional regulator
MKVWAAYKHARTPPTMSEPPVTAANEYAAMMVDYAAGGLAPAAALVVETHLALRPDRAEDALAADALGGLLLEAMAPTPMASAPLPSGFAQLEPRLDRALSDCRARIRMAAEGGEGLAWRRRFPGWGEHVLPVAGASLVRIGAGKGMPRHGHGGQELTLVLYGAFEDEFGRYEAGDMLVADGQIEHRPRVSGRRDCICLTAVEGGYRLPWWANLAQTLTGRA